MSFAGDPENPYLRGPYAPCGEERTVESLPVLEGELPRDLDGIYVRNGPDPRFAPIGRHHWFDGDGMLHAITFRDGRASYRNRWVRTGAFAAEEAAGQTLWTGIMERIQPGPDGAPYKNSANTDVRFWNGSLYALWYLSGAPYRVDPMTLETRGVADWGCSKTPRCAAHAKIDETTGELLFFDYGMAPPFMRYGVVGASQKLEHLVPIELPGPRLPHDMAFTQRYAILMDLPVFFSNEALSRGRWKSEFFPELPARFGVIPRRGSGDSIRWFEASPAYVYHVVNAWEEGEKVVLVGCRVADPLPAPDPGDGAWAVMLANLRVTARLWRWTFDLTTGAVTEEALDDRNTDFPSIDTRAAGAKSRASYHMRIAKAPTLTFDAIVKYDLATANSYVHELAPGCYASESPYAPRSDAGGRALPGEDNGYVLSFVRDEREARSEVHVLHAQDLSLAARVLIPARVPNGFHATFVRGEQLRAAAGTGVGGATA